MSGAGETVGDGGEVVGLTTTITEEKRNFLVDKDGQAQRVLHELRHPGRSCGAVETRDPGALDVQDGSRISASRIPGGRGLEWYV